MRTLDRIREEGHKANEAGKTEEENPYLHGTNNWMAWLQGYNSLWGG